MTLTPDRTFQARRDRAWDNLPELKKVLADVEDFCSHQSLYYAMRDEMRARVAELEGPAELPPDKKLWSDRQWNVAKCPRCGVNYQKKGAKA